MFLTSCMYFLTVITLSTEAGSTREKTLNIHSFNFFFLTEVEEFHALQMVVEWFEFLKGAKLKKLLFFSVQQPPQNFLGFGVSLEKFNRKWVRKREDVPMK